MYIRAALPVLLLVGLAACGTQASFSIEEDGSGDGSGDIDLNGDGIPDPQDPPIPEEDVVTVYIDPGQSVYRPGAVVTVSAALFEEGSEDPTPDIDFVWSVAPASSATLDGPARFLLDTEGPLTFTACVDEVLEEDDSPRCGDLAIAVDAGPPTIEITFPPPGAFLGGAFIPVEGIVNDTGFPPRVFISGIEVPVEDDGTFSHELEPEFGVMGIEARATDSVNEREGTDRIDVLWADSYVPPISPAVIDYDRSDALTLRLGRNFFDDGEPYFRAPEETRAVSGDLVGVVELVLAESDLMAQIPDPLIDSDALSLRVTDLIVPDPTVSLEITETGIELFVQLAEIEVITTGSSDLTTDPLDLNGSVTASVSVFLQLDIAKPLDGPVEASIRDFGISLDALESDFVSEEANALFEVVGSALRTNIFQGLSGYLEESLLNEIPAAIVDVFSTIDEALNFDNISIAADPLPPVELSLGMQVTTLTTTFQERIDVMADASVGASGTPAHPSAPGVPLPAPQDEEAELFSAGAFQIALDLALLNGAAYSLWDAGMLTVDVTEAAPQIAFLADSVELDALLPPVITIDLNGDLLFTIGQMHIILRRGDIVETHAFHIEARATLDDSMGGLSLVLDPVPEIEAWVQDREGTGFIFADSNGLRDLIVAVIWPELTAALEGGLDLPLPEIPIDLSSVSPTLSDFVVRFALLGDLETRGNFVVLEAILEGSANLAD